jgi:hypothetical protein
MDVGKTSTVNSQQSTAFLCFAALMVDGLRRLWLRDVGRTSTLNNQPSTVFFNNQQSTINNQQSTAFLCFAADPMY